MKKLIIIFLSCLSLYVFFNKTNEKEMVKIPDSAIRFRVLANSNSPRDQKIKEDVRNRMQNELYNLLKSTRDINVARVLINDKITYFNDIVAEEIKDAGYSYTIDYGMHDFPTKVYKGITYEAGKYESLLVTLGEGQGDNWWCVLFPPLCLLEAEETSDTNEVEYKSFIKELIEKYF